MARGDGGTQGRCPSRDELGAFSRSEARTDAWSGIVEHLGQCTTCRQILRVLDQQEYPFLAILRSPQCADPILKEPEYESFSVAARLIISEDRGNDRGSSQPLLHLGIKLIDCVGKGSFGKVYLGRSLATDEDIAVKVISKPFQLSSRAKKWFRMDVERADQLTEGLIPNVVAIEEGDRDIYVIAPFLVGTALSRIVSDRALAKCREHRTPIHRLVTIPDHEYLQEVIPLLGQAISAVGRLHKETLLHGTLTTSNLFIEAAGRIRILDFGLFRLTGSWGGVRLSDTCPMSASINDWTDGLQLSHLGFISPEEWKGHSILDQRVDVFQLGVTAYQALTLRLPLGKGPVTRRTPAPVDPSKHQPLIPRTLDAVLLKALARDREERYPTAAEFAEDWRHATAQFVQPPAPSAESKPGRSFFSFLADQACRLAGRAARRQ